MVSSWIQMSCQEQALDSMPEENQELNASSAVDDVKTLDPFVRFISLPLSA